MKNKFLQGTVILLCSSIILRGFGFVYQMLVVRYAGTEALGILNMTMPFYMLLVVMATMGTPVAITKLAAEYFSNDAACKVTKMMRTAFALVFALSIFCLLVACFVMPGVFELLHTEERVRQCFKILIPGIVIVPFCSVMRGYFQGKQEMLCPSIGQVIEQLIRIVSGVVLILWVSPKDVLSLTISLAASAMLGELGGCLLLFLFYWYSRRKLYLLRQTETQYSDNRNECNGQLLKSLLSLGLPVTGTRLTSTIDMAIEASMVPACLIAIGYNTSQAASVYGQFSGVAVSLLMIPTVLTSALSTALTPAISGAAARHQHEILRDYCRQAISFTWMFSLPVIFILYLYGEELGQVLFHIHGLGDMMHWLSFGAVFLYLGQTVVGILQGLGMTRTVFINNVIGSVTKLLGMYYCIRFLGVGSNGIACGMILGYGLQCMLNIAALGQKVSLQFPWKALLLPIGNSLLMVVHLQLWEWVLPPGNIILFFVKFIFAGCGYLLIMMCTGQLKKWKQIKF